MIMIMIKVIGNAMRIYVNKQTYRYEICMYTYIYIITILQ